MAACGAPLCCGVNDSSRVDTRGPPLPWLSRRRPASPCGRPRCALYLALRVLLSGLLSGNPDALPAGGSAAPRGDRLPPACVPGHSPAWAPGPGPGPASTYPCQALGHVDQLHPLRIPGTGCCCLTEWEELGSEYSGHPPPRPPGRRTAGLRCADLTAFGKGVGTKVPPRPPEASLWSVPVETVLPFPLQVRLGIQMTSS